MQLKDYIEIILVCFAGFIGVIVFEALVFWAAFNCEPLVYVLGCVVIMYWVFIIKKEMHKRKEEGRG